MIDVIEQHRTELDNLCRRYRIRTLELFGSAADGTFDAARSDLDFLVEFLTLEPGQLFDFFFDLKDELQTLFRRRVDLVSPRAIRNPYMLKTINDSRQVVYAACLALTPSGFSQSRCRHPASIRETAPPCPR